MSGTRGTDDHFEPVAIIPDHQLLQRIGGGSYGEVWLARSATGARRAVKIVRRSYFDSPRPYDREFEGLLHFEPLSRRHEGLVDILQVGRSTDGESFYCVMELADNALPQDSWAVPASSQQTAYQPLTLESLIRQRGGRLPVKECVALTSKLAEALRFLHEAGLAHRDIKPSNIIFVGGEPKLADVGLVARTDSTRTFVGTEGFVPPEGAGTPQADIYSLGKCVYEMAMGKDRQAFPSPPTQLAEMPERVELLELNEVITKACDPEPKERYPNASALLAELVMLQIHPNKLRKFRQSQVLRQRFRRVGLVVGFCAIVAGLGGGLYQAHRKRISAIVAQETIKQDRFEYAGQINRAEGATSIGAWRDALQILLSTTPRYRNWEWGYLMAAFPQPVSAWRAHTNEMVSFASDTSSDRVATLGRDGLLKMWHSGSQALVWQNYLASDKPSLIQWSGDMTFFAKGGFLAVTWNGRLSIFDSQSGKLLIEIPKLWTPRLAGSLTEATLFVTTENTNRLFALRLEDDGQWKATESPQPLASPARSISLDRSGKYLVANGDGNQPVDGIYNARSLQLEHSFSYNWGSGGKAWLQLDSTRNRAFYVNWMTVNEIKASDLWALPDKHLAPVGRGAKVSCQIAHCAITPDDRLIAVADTGGDICVMERGTTNRTTFYNPTPLIGLGWQDTNCLSADSSGWIKCWPPRKDIPNQNGSWRHQRIKGLPASQVTISPNRRWVAVGRFEDCDCGTVLLDLKTGKLHQLQKGAREQGVFAFVPRSNLIALRSPDCQGLEFFEMTDDHPCLTDLKFRIPAETHGSFDSKGRLLICSRQFAQRAMRDGAEKVPFKVRVFDWRAQKELATTPNLDGDYIVALSPDGSFAAARGVYSPRLVVWKPANGQVLMETPTPRTDHRRSNLAFHPNRPILAVGDDQGRVQFWHVVEGKEIGAMSGKSPVLALVFNPDGERVITSAGDQTVTVWDWQSGQALLNFRNRFYSTLGITMSEDGKMLLTTDGGNPELHIRRALPWGLNPDSSEFLQEYSSDSVRLPDATASATE